MVPVGWFAMGSSAVRRYLSVVFGQSIATNIMRTLGLIVILIYSVWLIFQRGVPTHPTFIDHSAHMYKAYLAQHNEVYATHWSGANLFWIGPVFYAWLWLFDRIFYFTTAYRVAYLVTLLLIVLLSFYFPEFTIPFVTVYGIGSVVVGRFPGLLAFLFGALSFVCLSRRKFWLSLLFILLAIFSEPADALLWLLLYVAYVLDLSDGLRNLRSVILATIPVVIFAAYGLFLLHMYPHASSVLRASLFSGVSANSPTRVFLALLNTVPILLIVLWFAYRFYGQFPFTSILLVCLSLYFLIGWEILPSSFPLAKVWPLSYVIFFVFVLYHVGRTRNVSGASRVLGVLSIYLLIVFPAAALKVLPVGVERIPVIGMRVLPQSWHYSPYEHYVSECARLAHNTVWYVLYDPWSGGCGDAPYFDTFLNVYYGIRTPRGGVGEILPGNVVRTVHTLLSLCESHDCSALRNYAMELNACILIPHIGCGGVPCSNAELLCPH